MRTDGFLVEPIDTIWLGGGVPAAAGAGDTTSTAFPPTPWTFQGVVRARLLFATAGSDGVQSFSRSRIEQLVGMSDALPVGWALRGPLVVHTRRDRAGLPYLEPWVRCPHGLLRRPPTDAIEAPTRAWPISEQASKAMLSGSSRDPDAAAPLAGFLGPVELRPLRGWITLSGLRWALTGQGEWTESDYYHFSTNLPPVVEPEVRVGIELDSSTGTARDQALYTGTHHRFAPSAGLFGRLVWDQAEIPGDALRTGTAPLGRKGRLVRFESASLPPALDAFIDGEHLGAAELPNGKLGLRVVLLTPTPCTREGLPCALPELSEGTINLVAAMPVFGALGGFDRARNGPRPVRRVLLPGSAWLFEIEGGTADGRTDAARRLAGCTRFQTSDMERFGFGLRVAGFCDEAGEPLNISRNNP
ncbi:MAG: hypothetical protein JW940_14640 [Polyangiaceae bacterium]|nr:hypothetical protein [Polyangiaceae bacterium]